MGVVKYGNSFFKELVEVTDEVLASGSLSGEDFLVADEYPYYVKACMHVFSLSLSRTVLSTLLISSVAADRVPDAQWRGDPFGPVRHAHNFCHLSDKAED